MINASLAHDSLSGASFPLSRFIRACSKDVMLEWAKKRNEAREWIFDPFCSNPLLPIELAQVTYKVFTCCNNPVIKTILQALALALPERDIREILNNFGNEKRGEVTLKDFLLSLYKATCSTCHAEVTVSRYLWEREPLRMVRKIFFCPTCNATREEEISEEDLRVVDAIAKQPLPLTWAFNRLGVVLGSGNSVLKDAIGLYTHRALLALFTLINRLEALQVEDGTKIILRALTICGCDGGTGFWNESGETPSLKQLIKPATFIEYNIWQYLENSVECFTRSGSPTMVSEYPELPKRNGICVFNGRARFAFPLPDMVKIGSIITQLPRINPVFLTLSGLWAGWIFGQERVRMMQGVFHRRDYDWQWQSRALTPTFSVLSRFLPGVPCLAQEAEATNGSILADGIASQSAGWMMNWHAFDPQGSGIYFELEKLSFDPVTQWYELKEEIAAKMLDDAFLVPGAMYSYDQLFARMVCVLSKESRFIQQAENIPLALLPDLQVLLNEITSSTRKLVIEDPSLPVNKRRWKANENE